MYDEGIASLGDSYHSWVNDPGSAVNLQIDELIEHIATNIFIFKLTYHNESDLTNRVETFSYDNFTLFSSYGINNYDIQRWYLSRRRLFRTFSETESIQPEKVGTNLFN
ncbi:Biofilm formation regulator YbaJ [Sodalis-like endosymbiont of Proechinophthirus fluctus]|nr:Biofilm formation regulator YbaJ [Sodalis-like endosymbiont of Proechinophthirus fluctus]